MTTLTMCPSQETFTAACSHFGTCGGCRFQHVPYEEQLLQKQNFIESLFSEQAKPILACDPPWRYRNKMEFTFSEAKDGKRFLGLFQKGSRGKVTNLEECHLTSNWFIESLKKVYTWWSESSLHAYRPLANVGELRTLTLREGHHTNEKLVMLTVSGGYDETIYPFLEKFTALFNGVESVILRKQFVQKKTPTRFEEEVLSGRGFIYEYLTDDNQKKWKFKIRPTSFFQPNTRQAEKILKEAVSHIDGGVVFDLYCGTGSIGIFASQKAEKVIGIELSPESVADAHDNLRENDVSNMEVHQGDVEKVLSTIKDIPDVVIVDPPRAGLSDKTISTLLELKPKKIIYISCNPVSQWDNCRKLGYKIYSMQPVDQFPHTPHIENVAILMPK